MRIAAALMACALMGCAHEPSLVGAWRLERYVDTPDGEAPIEAFGAHPVGLFVFSADGRASVNIMRNPPGAAGEVADPDPDACVPDWYCSYFGAYSVDWTKRSWTIHVEGGNIASFIGTDQTRSFSLKGDRLVLRDAYTDGSRTIRTERVLVRTR
ncbi:MAG: lipocalin-like domain-containing protein [Hyphomonadaceae bacterium]|nr:lipocalin-like domain-containing protein [Hyphomonadaceae bacterium]